jgi:hypothetical protein
MGEEITVTIGESSAKVYVQRADDLRGRVSYPARCPLALAIRDALDWTEPRSLDEPFQATKGVWVVSSLIRIAGVDFEHTPESRAFMRWYDHRNVEDAESYPEPRWPLDFTLRAR